MYPFDMYYAIASDRKLQMKLNVTHKRREQALMQRGMDTSVIFSIKDNRTGNVSLLYSCIGENKLQDLNDESCVHVTLNSINMSVVLEITCHNDHNCHK